MTTNKEIEEVIKATEGMSIKALEQVAEHLNKLFKTDEIKVIIDGGRARLAAE